MQQTPTVDYGYLRQLVYGLSQNVLDPSRDYLFETRLSSLMRRQGMKHLNQLVDRLKLSKDPLLERSIAEAMTINETSFFRDTSPFELLRTELLPKLIQARYSSRKLRFWSAACSNGQEAYSLGMMILEHFPTLASWDIRIEGTDICSESVQVASAGRYQGIEMNRGLPASYGSKYFQQAGTLWEISEEVRKMCNFRQANLCGPNLPFCRSSDRFDLILLRNVMLYFSPETRCALLAGIHRTLEPDGILFLGSSEQPADPSIWTSVVAGGTCYFKPRRAGQEPGVSVAHQLARL